MSEFEIEVAGRFSALEYVLEVILANQLSFMQGVDSQAFKDDLIGRDGYIRSGLMVVDDMERISESTQKVLENFLEKVSEREGQIRSATQ